MARSSTCTHRWSERLPWRKGRCLHRTPIYIKLSQVLALSACMGTAFGGLSKRTPGRRMSSEVALKLYKRLDLLTSTRLNHHHQLGKAGVTDSLDCT